MGRCSPVATSSRLGEINGGQFATPVYWRRKGGGELFGTPVGQSSKRRRRQGRLRNNRLGIEEQRYCSEQGEQDWQIQVLLFQHSVSFHIFSVFVCCVMRCHLKSACPSLNLTLCDMANSCSKAITFFGVIQRIYVLFSSSTKRWKVLLDHVPSLTLKSLSNTRWESRIKSVKAIRYQAPEVRAALFKLSKSGDDAKDRSDAKKLYDVVGTFEFLLSMVIWHDILFAVNMVSKTLQSPSMCIDSTLQQIEGIMKYFDKYRSEGFVASLGIAKKLAADMSIRPSFPIKRRKTRKKHFDESDGDGNNNEEILAADMANTSLKKRFEELMVFKKIFGFLLSSSNLKSLDDIELRNCCTTFAKTYTHKRSCDVELDDFFSE